jgi:hypothetical protein
MSEPRHSRLREVFDAALELPVGERPAFVARECDADGELAAQVLRLLAASDDEEFLAVPELAALPSALRNTTTEGPGLAIGRYRLVRQVGEGGFGTVWLADQREPVVRQVALKILKPGMDSTQVVARFEQERQALAHLDHPHIARVLDAGETPAGRPFFVMEFVDGQPLVEFCDQQRLSVAERLRLFVQVCDAVQHAHGRGIIHRDLKPSNVLVGRLDGTPHAKVIDFGIAKAIDRKLTARTLSTGAAQVVGTLQYMSPEQAAGAADLDIRTDVWSLGVLLYELLTGSLPFAAEGADAWHAELVRQIREQDPLRPSARLSGARAQVVELAGRRRTTVQRLPVEVRGELDWIVMRALAKERARRYQTASDLAADLRRFLAGEPVLAAPPGATYLVAKFVRRHRVVVAAAAAVMLSLVGGVVAFAWQADVARGERDRALVAEAQGRQILDFLLGALNTADPFENGDADMRVTEAMERAASLLDDGRIEGQPAVEFALRQTIANILANLGDAARALPHAERALHLARELYASDHEQAALAARVSGRSPDRGAAAAPACHVARGTRPR